MSRFKLLEYYDKVCNHRILLDFQGAMTHDMLVVMGELIRGKLAFQFGNSEIVKRIFSVFIEMTQNISEYSEERMQLEDETKETGIGLIVLTEKDDQFTITSGNIIKISAAASLFEHCNRINGMDENDLKEFYKVTMRSPRVHNHNGAGVGLISVARKTGRPIHYNAVPIDDRLAFLVLSASIRHKNDAVFVPQPALNSTYRRLGQ